MKTELQRRLATVAPSVSIETIWEHDEDCEREWRELSQEGCCFHGEDRDAWECWQSEVRASVIHNGELLAGSVYLGGTWERYGKHPSEVNPDISGYEPQMTVIALTVLKGRLQDNPALVAQIDAAREEIIN